MIRDDIFLSFFFLSLSLCTDLQHPHLVLCFVFIPFVFAFCFVLFRLVFFLLNLLYLSKYIDLYIHAYLSRSEKKYNKNTSRTKKKNIFRSGMFPLPFVFVEKMLSDYCGWYCIGYSPFDRYRSHLECPTMKKKKSDDVGIQSHCICIFMLFLLIVDVHIEIFFLFSLEKNYHFNLFGCNYYYSWIDGCWLVWFEKIVYVQLKK